MPCPKCGQPTQPSDKFCNSCGFSLASAGAGAGVPPPPPASPFGAPPPPASPFGGPPPPPASPFGGPPPPPPPFEAGGGSGSPYGPPPGAVPGAPPGSRCAQGHDIAPGQSYCREGHPIALDAMNFGSDMYGAPAAPPPAPPYGQPPPFGAPPAYGAPPQSPFVGSPFGGAHPGQGPGAGPPGMPPGIQPPQAYSGGLPPAPPPFGDIPPSPPLAAPAPFGGGPPQPFGAPPGGFGPPMGYGQPPQPPQYGLQAPAARAPLTGGGPTNMLRGFLISFQSNPQGEFWPLFGGRLQVGRANTGELDIPLADATISSRHASLVIDGPSGTIFVEDTGSTNGTYVNDENIGPNGRRELRDGDRLRFGGYTTLVKVIGPLQ
ncbi:FHA domain-containing protein [Pendulispora brunnea]|uniref:FHA domain-containing protein n=1 Tax=Pendulispora brunnea TaxID=2905690 RepID=A0ABZ2KG29_9BACT